MQYDFDTERNRRGSDSAKWGKYGNDVLPMWVADMDFISAEPILRALHERVDRGFFGYTQPMEELCATIKRRLKSLYDWEVQKEDLFFLPGLVTGLNFAFQAFARPGEGVLVQPPVYHHFLKDPIFHGRSLNDPTLVPKGDTYEIDFDALHKAITEQTKIFILCNPHNPVARVYTPMELGKLAEICLRHGLIICSDEIHCDLIYPGYRHIPIATLSPEVAARTITLMAPSKTYNLAGLRCGFAVIQNSELKKIWRKTTLGLNPGLNIMGQVAALAGYKEGQEWLDQVMAYLKDNRDYLLKSIPERLPAIRMTRMEATYLAWLNCREAGIPGNPFEFFLKEAKVALNDGVEFGKGGEGFVRLNFACPRKTLIEAIERMSAALKRL
ncbi:MAG: PatB family C-S lyase [Thermodesulfobacteriota bacterium]|nr:PatB family C-S lyase [Thermodesulfobacteriota bacterium]